METIELINIPNFYSSYYLLGVHKFFNFKYRPDPNFEKFNNRGFLIFKFKGKIGIIDNHDPVGVNQDLYRLADVYFATNKLLNHPEYEQEKVKPIFPHFPVNSIKENIKSFGLSWFIKLKPKDFAREIYSLSKRPYYQVHNPNYVFEKFVFFSGSTWKKEPWANQIRAEFIRACKKHPEINFEGGFIPRSDGNNFGFDKELNTKSYPPKVFSNLSAKSLVNLNNPAVLGAVSWRLAEYWNAGTFVLSFPFAIDLPQNPIHGEEIHYISSGSEFTSLLDQVIQNPNYHRKVAQGGNSYFLKYCTPEKQWEYIASFF